MVLVVHQVLNRIVERRLQRKVSITSCLSMSKCRVTGNSILHIWPCFLWYPNLSHIILSLRVWVRLERPTRDAKHAAIRTPGIACAIERLANRISRRADPGK